MLVGRDSVCDGGSDRVQVWRQSVAIRSAATTVGMPFYPYEWSQILSLAWFTKSLIERGSKRARLDPTVAFGNLRDHGLCPRVSGPCPAEGAVVPRS